jgi:APA family basic amino acid/polyamine antiporter
MRQIFQTKSIDRLIEQSEDPEHKLKRLLGPWSLIGLGVGAVIGTGIFVLTGTAAAGETIAVASIIKAPVLDLILNGADAVSVHGRPGAGPGIAISFLATAIICGFAALCYAELASMIPIAGSAYTYAYATLGELTAWIIGWDLILEYAVSNMAVAVGFSAYFNDVLDSVFGFKIPESLSRPIFESGELTGAVFNLPAFLIVMALTVVLVWGIRESANTNNVMVGVKVFAILVFVFGAVKAVDPANYHPFVPNGFQGLLTGAAIVFFTYIGFDSVSTAAEECRNPQRDMPIGIIGTLAACAILYVSVALVLTGMTHWTQLGNASPVVNALRDHGFVGIRQVVGVGAVVGMVSSLMIFQYGQARIWFAMSRDGLLPSVFSKVHPRYRTPHISTWIAGILVGIPAGVWDIGTFADLASIGTLFAFIVVAAGVIILRRKQPERKRSFRVPGVPYVPMISIAACFLLMLGLPLETWIRFVVWLVIGLAIYWLYGRKHTEFAPR